MEIYRTNNPRRRREPEGQAPANATDGWRGRLATHESTDIDGASCGAKDDPKGDNHNHQHHTPKSRRPRVGPELNLVCRFLNEYAPRVPRNCRVDIFCEPRLVSGFPDLVAVTWHVPTAEKWSEPRRNLSVDDVRILQFLVSYGPAELSDFEKFFAGVPSVSLAKLLAAGVVFRRRDRWHAQDLSKIYAVRTIVAYEAKMSNSRDVLQQASINRWFASESYVLLPKVPAASFLDDAVVLGIGVQVQGYRDPVVPARREASAQPLSYASWMFNEWSWLRSR